MCSTASARRRSPPRARMADSAWDWRSLASREAVSTQSPQLIISDIGLPGEDGYALMRHIRAQFTNGKPRITAIALTAFARPEDRQHAMEAGFDEYFAKPVDTEQLLAHI